MTKEIPCPYCGQLVVCRLPEDKCLSEEEKGEYALSVCGCPMGRRARATKAQIAEAKDNINMLCGEGAEPYA